MGILFHYTETKYVTNISNILKCYIIKIIYIKEIFKILMSPKDSPLFLKFFISIKHLII